MEATVHWKDGLSFAGSAGSSYKVDLGGDIEVGGKEDGFRPLELMALSLAGCTAMDVISILQKKRQDIQDFTVHVVADRADEHPRVFTAATIQYQITGNQVDETAVIRAIELSASRYCPAQGMLAKILPIKLEYQIYDVGETGDKPVITGIVTI
jgi:putative redox protein